MLEILVVDDEQEIAKALQDFFTEKGYNVRIATNGKIAMEIVKEHRPHLVFLDIRMPMMDGLSVLRNIREFDKSIKVIMVTAFGTKEIMLEAKRLGAVDFIRKPFTPAYLKHDVIDKVNVQLFGDLREEIEEKNKLIDKLEHLNEKITRNFYQTVMSLAAALESRDRYTHGHSERVDMYSRIIAKEMASFGLEIDKKFLDNLHIESRLHDIGKIAVSDIVLNKPGKLTESEFIEIRKHPGESAKILSPLDNIQENIDVIYAHHERVDGKGYPARKTESRIPLRAKIIAVADAFDAMTSDRPYRKAIPVETAFRELEKNKNLQFDGNVVDCFISAYNKKRKDSMSRKVQVGSGALEKI
ncbi:MAG: response regulator [Candidatus Omnitrophica bacterium]|nr:response regulator [Candidatus Omnitrophota bacterium]